MAIPLSSEIQDLLASRLASSTRKAYAGPWSRWLKWSAEKGKPSLPAASLDVAEFLATFKKVSPAEKALAAIRAAHLDKLLPSPTASQAVSQILVSLKVKYGKPVKSKLAFTQDQVRSIRDELLPSKDLAVWRSVWTILMGYFMFARWDELARITRASLQFFFTSENRPWYMSVSIDKSKNLPHGYTAKIPATPQFSR